MLRPLIPALLLLRLVPVFAGEVVTIDDFTTYVDTAALQAAYEPMKGTPPAEFFPHGDKQALKIPCLSASVPGLERGSYDVKVNLDLSRIHTIAFDLYCDNPAGVSHFTIYLRSGRGWWYAGCAAPQGWKHISIPRSAFAVEPSARPNGWDGVDMIRVCAWPREAVDTVCAVGNLQGRTEDVAVVVGTQKGVRGGGAAGYMAEIMSGYLDRAGIAYETLGEADVEAGMLADMSFALFPFSPEPSDKGVAQVKSFVADGGKVAFFFVVAKPIADLLGVVPGPGRQRENSDDFAEVAFTPDALPGLPPRIAQDSQCMQSFTAAATHRARVIGTWSSGKGQDQGPAVLVSDNGAYMGYFLADCEPTAPKGDFLAALVGHFVPGAWETMATQAMAAARQVRPFPTMDDFSSFMRMARQDPVFGAKVAEALARANAAEAVVRQLMAEGRHPEARWAAHQWHEALVQAYAVAHRPRPGEFRGVWNASGTGDGGTWEETMQRLKAAGFSAVVPCMGSASAGVVYGSQVLPHAQVFEEKGDQLAQCVAAARRNGLEVHAWLMDWRVAWARDAGAAFVERLRAEHRLQVRDDGTEEEWLCPSDPRNFALLRDAHLEIVRKYDVDGIQFDYIRYPEGRHTCYCDGCRERFEAVHGAKVANWPADCYSGPLKVAYGQFRCDQITRLVKTVSEEAHRLKPYVKVSADVFGDYPKCRDDIGQDWLLWCQQGYLDFVCPMTFQERDYDYQQQVGRLVELVNGVVPVYLGIGAYLNPDEGVVAQTEIARRAGADGHVLFQLGPDMAATLLPKLALGIAAAPSTAPHAGPLVRFAPAGPGAVKVSVLGSGQHRQPVEGFAGRLELQDVEGRRVADLGALPATGQSVEVQIDLASIAPGLRLAAVGTMVFADGTSQPFVVRSQPRVITLR